MRLENNTTGYIYKMGVITEEGGQLRLLEYPHAMMDAGTSDTVPVTYDIHTNGNVENQKLLEGVIGKFVTIFYIPLDTSVPEANYWGVKYHK